MKKPLSRPSSLILGIFLVVLVPIPLAACSLCGSFLRQNTLGEEFESAKLVLYGRAVKSELGAAGSGRTEFHIDRVLKDDPVLTDKKGLILGRYLPVDPKDPPRMVVFCAAEKGKLDAYLGKGVRSEAVVGYLEGAQKPRSQGRVQALQYYFKFLDSTDDVIACDAIQEFARSSDQDVEQARRLLKPDKLRALLYQNPRTKLEHLGLLAFLLGGCGEQRDADELLALIKRDDEASRKARDGALAGYLTLKPREGWELLRSQLADTARSIPDRFRAINAMRLAYNLKLGEHRKEAIRCMEVMLPQADLADFAVEDLRKWEIWDLTMLVLAQYDKESHAAPITRRAILRYAMSCPRPEAKQFVERMRTQDPDTFLLVKQGLDFEKEADASRTPSR